MMQKRRTALAVAALFAFAAPALAAGAFVDRKEQSPGGQITTRYYDMSGTGLGPFVRAVMPLDTSGNVASAGCPSSAPCFFTPNSVLPIFESRERLARAGSYYVFATGNGGVFANGGLTVAAGSFLNIRTCNISSTKSAYVTKRIFDMNSTAPVAYGGVASPAPLSGTQVSGMAAITTAGSNVTVGSPASSVVQMSYSVGTGHVDNAAANAAPTGTGFLYPSDKNELTELRILPPGFCFGQYINGAAAGLGSIQLGFRMYEYEE